MNAIKQTLSGKQAAPSMEGLSLDEQVHFAWSSLKGENAAKRSKMAGFAFEAPPSTKAKLTTSDARKVFKNDSDLKQADIAVASGLIAPLSLPVPMVLGAGMSLKIKAGAAAVTASGTSLPSTGAVKSVASNMPEASRKNSPEGLTVQGNAARNIKFTSFTPLIPPVKTSQAAIVAEKSGRLPLSAPAMKKLPGDMKAALAVAATGVTQSLQHAVKLATIVTGTGTGKATAAITATATTATATATATATTVPAGPTQSAQPLPPDPPAQPAQPVDARDIGFMQASDTAASKIETRDKTNVFVEGHAGLRLSMPQQTLPQQPFQQQIPAQPMTPEITTKNISLPDESRPEKMSVHVTHALSDNAPQQLLPIIAQAMQGLQPQPAFANVSDVQQPQPQPQQPTQSKQQPENAATVSSRSSASAAGEGASATGGSLTYRFDKWVGNHSVTVQTSAPAGDLLPASDGRLNPAFSPAFNPASGASNSMQQSVLPPASQFNAQYTLLPSDHLVGQRLHEHLVQFGQSPETPTLRLNDADERRQQQREAPPEDDEDDA
jgi:hypothetical protein